VVHDLASQGLPVRQGELLLGKYLIGETLGAGGMGVVVVAEHVQLGQKVAVKFLSAELRDNRDAVGRFLREARAAASLRSEHVVRVVDVSSTQGDLCYMVMEYLDGKDLSQLLQARGHLPVPEAVGYLLQACEAIGEAHGLGIVHRDLKPGNLFLTHRPDGSPLIKVLDFGISKAAIAEHPGVGAGAGARGGRAPELTSTSMVLGSPMYMSPEQLRSAKNVDARTDVWSLGVILHELLTGQPAFNGETTMQVLATIVADPPTPLRQVRPDLPGALEKLVLDCLEKLPAQRLQSVSELVRRLAPFAPVWAASSVARVLGSSSRSDASGAPRPPRELADTDIFARPGHTQRLPGTSTTSAHLSGELVAAAAAERVSAARGAPRTRRRGAKVAGTLVAAAAVIGLGAFVVHNRAREPQVSPSPQDLAAGPPPVSPIAKPETPAESKAPQPVALPPTSAPPIEAQRPAEKQANQGQGEGARPREPASGTSPMSKRAGGHKAVKTRSRAPRAVIMPPAAPASPAALTSRPPPARGAEKETDVLDGRR